MAKMMMMMMMGLLSRNAIGGSVEHFMGDVLDANGVAIVDDPFCVVPGRRLIRRRHHGRSRSFDVTQKGFQKFGTGRRLIVGRGPAFLGG
jgi:hypothetical protein